MSEFNNAGLIILEFNINLTYVRTYVHMYGGFFKNINNFRQFLALYLFAPINI